MAEEDGAGVHSAAKHTRVQTHTSSRDGEGGQTHELNVGRTLGFHFTFYIKDVIM